MSPFRESGIDELKEKGWPPKRNLAAGAVALVLHLRGVELSPKVFWWSAISKLEVEGKQYCFPSSFGPVMNWQSAR